MGQEDLSRYSNAKCKSLKDSNLAVGILYLNKNFFFIRMAIYFVIWFLLISRLYNLSIRQKSDEDKIKMPESARAEGGDVMPWNEYIFVGYSDKEDFEKYIVARTNREGLDFLAATFPNKMVKGFELNKSDDDSRENPW